MAVIRIDLNQVLMESCLSSEDIVFDDKLFMRRHRQISPHENIILDILADTVLSSKIHHYFCSFQFKSSDTITFEFNDSIILEKPTGILILLDGSDSMLWFPKHPVLRAYDENGRIISSKQSSFTVEKHDSCVELSIGGDSDSRIEFPVLRFETDRELFLDEINNPLRIEKLKVTKDGWFFYEKINDVWDYLIDGYIYKTRHKSISTAWRCQQQANTLFNYINFLTEKTDKKIYNIISDLIAYSILISFPEDARWRHGSWTVQMETHARHQLEGIHLFLSYYEKKHQKLFLEKAQHAMDYLISIADKLADGNLWFLHDSLENNSEDYVLRYDKSLQNTAFGKSETNTLCLNTHLWTLISIHRLIKYIPEQKYKDAFESGIKSLRIVLQSHKGQIIFALVYGLWDFLVSRSLKTKKQFIKKLGWKYDQIVRNSILPRLKKKFPRLYMPNGFIERDLGCSSHSNGYHFINIRDLMLFYSLQQEQWLLPIIKKSLHYTVHGPLVKLGAGNEPFTMEILEAISLYTEFVDTNYASFMIEYLSFFHNIGNAFPADVFAYPEIGPFAEKIVSTKQICDLYNV